MKRNQVNNQEDLRKSVKNNKKRTSKAKKRNMVKFIFFLIVAIIVIAVIRNAITHKKIKLEQVSQYNYFVTLIDGKSGVIDKTGKTVVEPQYDSVQIPNPAKAIFICFKDNTTKVLNANNKEIYTQYKDIQAIPNNNTTINNTYQPQILKYKSNEKYGLISIDGNKITPANYDTIETLEYKDGVLRVQIEGKYGLIDINGDEIVKPTFNSITTDGYYNEGTNYEKAGYIVNVRTYEGYRYGYVNYKGRQTLDTIYTNIKRITSLKEDDTVYLITYKNGKAGILKNGQTLIDNEYEDIEFDGENKIFVLQQNAKQGIYDIDGSMILPIQYENIIFAGNYLNAEKDGKLLVFDTAGVLQNDDSYKSIEKVANGKYSITENRENQYGVMDNNKIPVIENQYSNITYAFAKYFIVSKNGKSGVADTNGNIIIPIEKDSIQNIKGTNILQVIDSNTKTTEIYNQNMEKVLTQTDARIYIKGNYIEIQSANEISYMDFDGNKKDAKDIFTNNKIFAKEKDGKWGYVDKDGNTVVDFKYDMAIDINEYGYGAIKLNGKWGDIDSNGTIVKEPTYEIQDYSPNFIGEYYEVSNLYEISYFSNEI